MFILWDLYEKKKLVIFCGTDARISTGVSSIHTRVSPTKVARVVRGGTPVAVVDDRGDVVLGGALQEVVAPTLLPERSLLIALLSDLALFALLGLSVSIGDRGERVIDATGLAPAVGLEAGPHGAGPGAGPGRAVPQPQPRPQRPSKRRQPSPQLGAGLPHKQP